MAVGPSNTLSWSAVAGASDYEVGVTNELENLNTGGTVLRATKVSLHGGGTSMSLANVFGSLVAGLYKVQVRALNGSPSPWSHGVEGTDHLLLNWDPALSAPTNLTLT